MRHDEHSLHRILYLSLFESVIQIIYSLFEVKNIPVSFEFGRISAQLVAKFQIKLMLLSKVIKEKHDFPWG